MLNTAMPFSESDDATLVSASLGGNRDAFGQIVARYQSLICSLAYSATGRLCQSEDVAQETFLLAWRQLRQLREPEKLRAWLCSIARSAISASFRRDQREPLHAAQPLEAVSQSRAPEPLPPDQAISQEQEALLWRSVKRLPPAYREPLVLFYREDQSIQKVAEQLELSEDAVKQRLSRGRKLLHREVLALVETSLARTRPGKGFTLAVVAALPALAPSTTVAAVTAAAVKGSPLVKSAGLTGLASTLAGPLIGLLGAWLGIRMSIRNTRSPRERQFMIRNAWLCLGLVAVFGLGTCAFILVGRSLVPSHRTLFIVLVVSWTVLYAVSLLAFILWGNRRQRQIQIEDGTYPQPGPAGGLASRPPTPAAIYAGLGGGILGGTVWLAIAAARAHDGWALSAIVLTTLLTFLAATRLSLRRPNAYFRAVTFSVVILGGLALALVNLRWEIWSASDPEFKNWSARGLSLAILLLYGIVALIFALRRPPQSTAGPNFG